jgi:hypothetical protein
MKIKNHEAIVPGEFAIHGLKTSFSALLSEKRGFNLIGFGGEARYCLENED